MGGGVLVSALATAALMLSCSAERPNDDVGTIDVIVDAESDGSLMLHVSNQSFEDSEVQIEVTLNGVPIIDREFDVGDQHNWIAHQVTLAPGRHALEATSSTGATFTTTFDIPEVGLRYAALNYWYSPTDGDGFGAVPRGFYFTIQDDPIGFA